MNMKIEHGENNSMRHGLEPEPLKVAIIGGGNWGTSIAILVAENCKIHDIFDKTVKIWVRKEEYKGRNLAEILNTDHVNPIYLPNTKLPENLVANESLADVAKDANLLVFVVPHQYVKAVVTEMKIHNTHDPYAISISLIKGIDHNGRTPILYSTMIRDILSTPCCVLSGANVAQNGIRPNEFSETTIGYKQFEHAHIWQLLFDRPSFKVSCIPDIPGVEVCGALKNVIAVGVGFSEGLNYGTNTTAAIIRMGFYEMRLFASLFFTNIVQETFFESAGIGDIIATCFGGRNAKCAKLFAEADGTKTWDEIETECLKGQKLQGPGTAHIVHALIQLNDVTDRFPLFELIFRIVNCEIPPSRMIEYLKTTVPIPVKGLADCTPCIIPYSLKPLKSKIIISEAMDRNCKREERFTRSE